MYHVATESTLYHTMHCKAHQTKLYILYTKCLHLNIHTMISAASSVSKGHNAELLRGGGGVISREIHH